MCNLLKLLTIIVLLLPLELNAIGGNDIRFSQLQPYPYSSPKAIVKDKFGFLWVGTDDGLLKYDGYSYRLYKNDPNDNESISSGHIRSLLLDSNGILWVATTNGLNKYSYDRDTFITYKFNDQEQNLIYQVFESTDKSLWIATKGGIKRKEFNKDSFENFNQYISMTGITKSIGAIRTFFQDIDDILWVGTITDGILRFDFATNKFIQLPKSNNIQVIVGIKEYTEETLIVGSNNSGIHIIKKHDGTDFTDNIYKPNLPKINVKDLMTDDRGVHWIATMNSGLFLLDGTEIRQFVKDDNDPKSLPSNLIYNIFEDPKKNIWISTSAGIAQYNPTNRNVENYYKSNQQNSLSNQFISSITTDSMGNIFFGTWGSGIDVLNKETGQFKNIKLLDKESNIISPNANKLLFVNNTLWVGSSDGLLYSKNLNIFSISTLQSKIISLIKINNDSLLAGTPNGLYLVNVNTNEILELKTFSGKKIVGITKAANRDFWVLTRKEGIYRVSSSGELLDIIDIKEIGGSDVISLLSLSNEYLWIGFFNKGLALFDLNKRKIIKEIGEKQGLLSNRIYTINNDTHGNIWVSTNNGIAKINKNVDTIEVFNEIDGLQSTEYNLGSFHVDKLGKFYYGGTTGASSFHPQRLKKNTKPPNVLWSKLIKIGKDSFSDYEKEIYSDISIGTPPLYKMNKLNMNYNDDLKIEFATTELLNSQNVSFMSRLTVLK